MPGHVFFFFGNDRRVRLLKHVRKLERIRYFQFSLTVPKADTPKAIRVGAELIFILTMRSIGYINNFRLLYLLFPVKVEVLHISVLTNNH